MKPLISIIVPVYNVEKYLKRCIKRIQEQSYENLEIILVDDGSTDESGELCDSVANTDARICVIHKENGGLSDARNTGLAFSKGEYIAFVDSDDWIEQETIQKAYLKSVDTNAEVVVWGYSADFVTVDEQLESHTDYALSGTCSRNTGGGLFASQNAFGLFGYAWNKLYKRSIVIDLKFCKGISLVEDILFNASVAQKSNRIDFIDFIGTQYIQRSRETLGTKYYPNYVELKQMAAKAMMDIMNAYSVPNNEAQQVLEKFHINTIKSAIRMIAYDKETKREKKEKMYQLVNNDWIQKMIIQIVPNDLKSKVLFALVRAKAVNLLLLFSKN